MKKIILSVGVVALGASAVQGANTAGLSMGGDNSKAWSVQGTLRGFYDDNYATATDSSGDKHGSYGVSVIPSVALNFPMDQTTLSFRYTFTADWYQDRTRQDSANDPWDLSHNFEALMSHSFNERYTLDVMDSFVISQEPGLIDSNGANTFPYRTESDNIRNHGEINLTGVLTPVWSFVLGYQNTYYNYKDDAGTNTVAQQAANPSLSGLLDRMEHEALVNLRYQAKPKTVLVAGYNYRLVDYSSDEAIAFGTTDPIIYADARNNHSHIVYGGFDQNFSKELIFTLRAGAQMLTSDNPPAGDPNKDSTSPWGSMNLTYLYLPGSSAQIGFRHARNQTDVVAVDSANNNVTVDQQTSVLFANVSHRLTSDLTGRLTGMWQYSEFFGGTADGETEQFYDIGVGLNYRFNQHFSGEVGYNYSQLSSYDSGRDYNRNRVFIGVTAAY